MPYSNDLLMSVARLIARMGTVDVADANAYAGSVLRAWSSPAPSAGEAFTAGAAIIRDGAAAGYLTITRKGVKAAAKFKAGISRTSVAPGDVRPAVSMRDAEVLADADILNDAMWLMGEMKFTTHVGTAHVLRQLKAAGAWVPSKEEDRSVNWHCRSNGDWYLSPFADWRGRVYLQSGSFGSPMTDHINRGCTDLADAKVASLDDQAYVAQIISSEYDLTLSIAKDFLSSPVEWCATHGVPSKLGCFTRAAWALVEMSEGKPCGFIVQQDASCSGFQIMALLTGDESLAEQVNLLSEEKQHDLYTFIATEAGIFEMLAGHGITNTKVARSCAKAVVMLVGYGAGIDTVGEGILGKGDDMQYDSEGNPIAATFGGVVLTADQCTELAQAGVNTLYQLFPSLEGMKKAAQQWAKSNGSTSWVSPSGLQCVKRDITVDEESGEVYADAGAAGALPNLVHSIDGAIAAKAIATFGAPLVTIHDSFGSSVCDARRVRRCVAEAYIWAVDAFDSPFELPSVGQIDNALVLDSALVA